MPKDMWYRPLETLASPEKMRRPPNASVAVSAVPFLRYVGLSAPGPSTQTRAGRWYGMSQVQRIFECVRGRRSGWGRKPLFLHVRKDALEVSATHGN